jgi:parallel beta-helix repeat protein
VLDRSSVSGNTAASEGGGIYTTMGTLTVTGSAADPTIISGNTGRNGGGIYNAGELSLGGLPGIVDVARAVISDNMSHASGGGIFTDGEGQLTVVDSTVTGNLARDYGGGLANISKTTLSVARTTFSANRAVGEGGAVYTHAERATTIADSVFTGNAAGVTVPALDGSPEPVVGQGGGGALLLGGSGVGDVRRSTFTSNSATDGGGGIEINSGGPLTMADNVVRENSSGAGGGGIETTGFSSITLERMTIADNTAVADGGGIETHGSGDFAVLDSSIFGNVADNGGGLSNAADGTLLVRGSAIYDNRARGGTALADDGSGLGGGVYGLGDSSASYENTTISGNVARERGGGLYIDADGDVHLVHVTITRNSAPHGSGVGGPVTSVNFPIEPSASVLFRNTIVGDNRGGPNCVFAIGSEGGNLDDGTSCYFRGTGDRVNILPRLDAIADNGGLTPTHALRPESLAVDGGVSPCPATDQRGVARPQNAKCDMGAYEFEGEPPPPDFVEPDTEYVSGPTQVAEATMAFYFTGTDNVTPPEELTFECRVLENEAGEPPEPVEPGEPLDPALAFVGCSSPYEVPALDGGSATFEVRAIDRAGNIDSTPDVHQFSTDDFEPPNTIIAEHPLDESPAEGIQSTGRSATFTFTGTDNVTPPQFLEIECRIDATDPEAWLECTNPWVFSDLATGVHVVEARAADGGDNVDPTPARFTWTVLPPLDCDSANVTLTGIDDGFVDEEVPQEAHIDSFELGVRAGELDARTFVRFPLTNDAPDCTLHRAKLRLHGAGTPDRVLEAVPVDAAWARDHLTWLSQPGATGTPATTTSGEGYREWDVTAHVNAIFAGTLPNHGWLVRDADENLQESPEGGSQTFTSRYAPQSPPEVTVPQLVLSYVPDGLPPPDAPDPAADESDVFCGQVLTESTKLANDLVGCLGEGLVIGASDIVVDLNGHTVSSGLFITPGEEDGLLAGIRNGGHDNVVIRNGTVEKFGYGVRLMGGATYNVVEGLTLKENVLAGIELLDADDGRNGNTIRNNVFDGNGDGVALVSGSQGSTVTGNTINGNMGASIRLLNSSGNTIASNEISGLTHDPLLEGDGGIFLDGATDNVLIGNTASDTGDAAVVVEGGSHRNRIEDNVFFRTGDSGVAVADSDETEIVGNVLHQTADAAIELNGANDGLVSGNDVRFNPGGISLENSSGNRIEANDASGSLGAGISAGSGSLLNEIVSNTIVAGRAAGISVEGEAVDSVGNPIPGNVIEGNTANQNLANGISVSAGGHTVTGNTANNNNGWGITAGALVTDGGANSASGNGEAGQCSGVVCLDSGGVPLVPPDTIAPDTSITEHPPNPSDFVSVSFEFTGTDDTADPTSLRFWCRLDPPPDPPPPPPDTEPLEPGEVPEPVDPTDPDTWAECKSPVTYRFLELGEHRFEVRASDPADNTDFSAAFYEWTVLNLSDDEAEDDETPPSTTLVETPPDPSTSTSATFRFRGSDDLTPGSLLEYECRIDSTDEDEFDECMSPTTYDDLGLGAHTFDVRTIDSQDNADPTPATYTWTIEEPPPDNTAPETTIDSGPDPTTVSTTAEFTFSADEPLSVFKCALDGDAFAPCASPAQYTGVVVGEHQFRVFATDPTGNEDPSPAIYPWTVGEAPVETAVSCGQVLTQSTLLTNDLLDCLGDGLVVGADDITIDLNGHTIDGTSLGSGIRNPGFDSVTIRGGTVREFDYGVLLDRGTAHNIVEEVNSNTNELASIALSNADDGTNGNTLRFNTLSGSGNGILLSNGTQDTWVYDNTLGVSSGQGIRIEGSSGNVVEANDLNNISDAAIVLEGSSDNELIRNSVIGAADAAFAIDLGSHRNRIVENTITDSEAGINVLESNGNELIGNTVHNSGDNGISLESANDGVVRGNDVRFNGGGLQLSTSSRNVVEHNDASHGGSGIELGDGSLENVIFENTANFNSAEGISIGAQGLGGLGNRIEGNSASDNGGNGITVGSTGHLIVGNDANNNDGWGIYAAGPTVSGTNVDGGGNNAVGNKEPLQCVNVVCDGSTPPAFDVIAPDTWIFDGPPSSTVFGSATFRFDGSDNASAVRFECRLDGEGSDPYETDCSSPKSYDSLDVGEHRFEARAIDWSGNIDLTPATYTWTIEALAPGEAPETTIDSGPDATTASTSATFTFSSSEPGSTFECALDTAPFNACESPLELTGLEVGQHELLVRAIDGDDPPNTDPTPASYSWTVTPAPVAATVQCGQVITQSTLLTNDLIDCAGDGIVIGAHRITLDLNGHQVDGTGLGVGIRNPRFDGVRIANGHVQEFDFGIQIDPGAADNVVSAMTLLLNQEVGIQLSGNLRTAVRDNDVRQSTAGIVLAGGTDDAEVVGNVVVMSSGDGILLQGSSGNLVESNDVSQSSGAGVTLEGSGGNVVVDNILSQSSGSGVAVTLASHGNRIERNELESSGGSGIEVTDSNENDLLRNVARESGGEAIVLTNANDGVVQGNDLRFNPGGLSLSGSSRNRIEGNNASAISGAGITLEAASLDNDLIHNLVSGNAGEGMFIGDGAPLGQGNLIESNTASSNSGDGIHVAGPGHTITGNVADHNEAFGIFAVGGNIDGGGNRALGNAEPGQCSGVVCETGPAPGAPETELLEFPPDPSNSRNAMFSFTGSDNDTALVNLEFECRLDTTSDLAWLECEPPMFFTALSPGEHTFQVRAVDIAGNVDATPVTYTWTYEPLPPGIPPDTFIDTGPPTETPLFDAIFEFHSSEPDVTFECKLDNGPFEACANTPEMIEANYFAHEVVIEETQIGPHVFQVRARDFEGNVDPEPATYEWTILGMTATITSGPAFIPGSGGDPPVGGETSSTDATFEFFSNDPDATFQCALDLHGFEPCSSPWTYTGLAVAEHSFQVFAENLDEGTAQLEPTEYEWTIIVGADTQAPETTITSQPADNSSDTTFTFTATDNQTPLALITFECRLDSTADTAWYECLSPHNLLEEITVDQFFPGVHTFEVRAVDAAEPTDPTLPQEGNADPTPATYTWTSVIDETPPQVTILSAPPSPSAEIDVVFEFSGTDNQTPELQLTFECSLDGLPFEQCTSPHDVQGLAPAEHTFRVQAVDLAQNRSASASHTWTVVEAPETEIDELTAPASGESTSATFDFFSPNDPSATFECALDPAPPPAVPAFTACPSGVTYDGLALGEHRFEVRAKNTFGFVDETPAVWEWTIEDISPPQTTIHTHPDALTSSPDADFSFSANEPATFECALDTDVFTPCDSPRSYFVGAGEHTFQVRATDLLGNLELVPATWEWTVEGAAPPPGTPADPAPAVVECGDVLTASTLVMNDLTDCAGEGLVIGASTIIVDINWHTIDGPDYFVNPLLEGELLPPAGIRNSGFDNVTVRDGTVQQFGDGVLLNTSSTANTLQGLTLSQNATAGVRLSGATGAGITGNTIDRNAEGVSILDGSQDNVLSDNTLSANLGIAVRLVGSSENRLELNTIDGLLTTGLPGSDVGIQLEGSSDNVLFDNDITDTGDAGVVIEAGSHGNEVESNTLERTGDAGVTIADSNGNDVVGNIAQQVSDAGIALSAASDGLVQGNDVRLNAGGIELENGSTGNEIVSNDASLTTGIGISLGGGSIGNVLRLNTASGNGGHGIFVGDEAPAGSGNVIEENTANGNQGSGIFVDKAVHTITGNMANDNGAWGIFAGAGNTDGGGNVATGNFQLGQCSGVVCNGAPGSGPNTPAGTDVTVNTTTPHGRPATVTFTSVSTEGQTTIAVAENAPSLPEGYIDAGSVFYEITTTATFTGVVEVCLGYMPAWYADANAVRLLHSTNDSTWTDETASNDAVGGHVCGEVTTLSPFAIAAFATEPDTFIDSGPASPSADTTVTVTFHSDQSATFTCSLDGVDALPCTSPHQVQVATDGEHVFQVQATNAFQLTDETPAEHVWIAGLPPDTTEPETTIDSGPASLSSSIDATFTFTGSDNRTPELELTFECRLDEVDPWESCSSPHEIQSLAFGEHTFEVRAVDLALNADSTPEVHTWTIVDFAAPETTIDSGPPGTTDATTATFTFSADETPATFECKLDGASFAPCTSPHEEPGPLAVGPHSFQVRAADADGNADSTPDVWEWTIEGPADTTPPDTEIVSGPGTPAFVDTTFVFSATEAGATFECALDGPTFESCESPYELSVEPGDHELQVIAVDVAGNPDTSPDIWTWTAVGPPDTFIDVAPSSPSGTTATFEFSSDQPESTFQCALDEAEFTFCNSPREVGGLTEGAHTFQVQAVSQFADAEAMPIVDESPATHEWTVEVPPDPSDPPPPEPETTISSAQRNGVEFASGAVLAGGEAAIYTFIFSSDDSTATFECALGAETFSECLPGEEYTGLAAGPQTFQVRAVNAGLTADSTPDSHSWTIEAEPDTTLLSGPEAQTDSTSVTFTFSSPSAGVTFECSLDLAPFAGCASGDTYTGVPYGEHQFEVRAKGPAGTVDTGPAIHAWESGHLTAPVAEIDSGPPAETESTSATFTLSSADADADFLCSLDGSTPAFCESPKEYTGLAFGDHTFEVTATRPNLLVEPVPASYGWAVVDQTPAVVEITSAPDANTVSTTATFEFTGTDNVALPEELTFECALDTETFTECPSPSPVTYTSLPLGDHTFRVRAIDPSLNEGAPAVHNWTIGADTTEPETTITSDPGAQIAEGTLAVFTFSSDEADATFQCSVDGEPFSECTSPVEHGLDPGQHTFSVGAVDAALNEDGTPATHTWTVVNTPVGSSVVVEVETPVEATLTFDTITVAGVTTVETLAAPADPPDGYQIGDLHYDVETTATFSGPVIVCFNYDPASVADPTALALLHYEDPAWVDVTDTNDTIAGLICGDVTTLSPFGVATENPAPPPDTADPDTEVTGQPANPTEATDASFTFTGSDNETAAGELTFACRLDSSNEADFDACTNPKPYTGLGLGSHTFEVRASDAAGNVDDSPASYTWTIEAPPPPVDCGSPATLTATADAWVDEDNKSRNRGTDSTLRVMSNRGDARRALVQFDLPTMPDGCVVDSATLRLYAGSYDNGRTLQAYRLAGAWSERQVTWNNQPATNDGPAETSSGSGYREWDVAALVQAMYANGNNGFLIRDADEADSDEQQLRSREASSNRPQLVVELGNGAPPPPPLPPPSDTTPPETNIVSGPSSSTTSTSASLEFSSSESGSTYRCRLDSQQEFAFMACTSPKTYTGLSLGSHIFEVRAIDPAGNVDQSPSVHTWTIETAPQDTTPPETTIVTKPADPSTSTSAQFAFSSSESGSTFECKLDAGSFATCTSPVSLSGLALGSHTFEVRATDAAGNEDATPAGYTWTVEAAGPAPVDCGNATTVSAEADAWVDQSSPSSNKGDDSILKVMSKSGANLRALVHFALPAVPESCVLDTATLRMYAASYKENRTLEVLRLAAAWDEGEVTWANQPGTSGSAVTTTSGSGYREWNVAALVAEMYASSTNNGFLIRDATEGQDAEQQFHAREKGESLPQLVIGFKPSS